MTLDYEPISQWSADGERGVSDIAEVLRVPSASQLREQELRLFAASRRAEKELFEENQRLRAAEHALSNAYLRIRGLLAAWDTPYAPTGEQVWAHTEEKAQALVDERDVARASVEMLTAALKTVEWLKAESRNERYEVCLECSNRKERGHTPDCIVGNALRADAPLQEEGRN